MVFSFQNSALSARVVERSELRPRRRDLPCARRRGLGVQPHRYWSQSPGSESDHRLAVRELNELLENEDSRSFFESVLRSIAEAQNKADDRAEQVVVLAKKILKEISGG